MADLKKTLFEKSIPGQKAWSLPKEERPISQIELPGTFRRKEEIRLPEAAELSITRHFSQLAKHNMGIDTHFYPLGSCTMKFNPRINEECASFNGFANCHPLAPDETVQGSLFIMHELIRLLCELSGMDQGSLSPSAGAQGELTGILMIKKYFEERNESFRNEIIIPDSAHGTNPATAVMAGYKTISIESDEDGDINLDDLKNKTGPKTAGLMLTNPNTLGLFSRKILSIAEIIHDKGGLLYYDGANLNAIMEIVKPGLMGFDVMHLNLHKTFSTPHGGGGPGSGPILCKESLSRYLPLPWVQKKENDFFRLERESESSIGQISFFNGNFGVFIKAYLYFIIHGFYGLRKVSENAVLNANYLKIKLSPLFKDPFKDRFCMHEFVLQADRFLDSKVKALDIAKRMLDYGIYAPTIYFPLIIKECLLIEPTETESKSTLDAFIQIMEKIVEEANNNPDLLRNAPFNTPVRRLDEVRAARSPILKHAVQ